MARSTVKAEPQRADTKGEGLVLLPNCVTRSAQWKALGFRAREVVRAVASHFTGYNNGAIGVSARQLADDLGSSNAAANDKALQEAILAGFLERTTVYAKALRRGSEYRLTWVNTGRAPHMKPATHDYLAGEVVKQKRPQPQKPHSIIETGAFRPSKQAVERPVSTIETGEAKKAHLPASTIETLLIITTPSTDPANLGTGGNTSGRPRSVPEDVWILAQRRAAANPATCDEDHVRRATREHLEKAERGEQSRLCKAADVPVATFSRFLGGGSMAPDRVARVMGQLLQRQGGSELGGGAVVVQLPVGGCEKCKRPVPTGGRGPRAKRFCSERCRKAAERARAYDRKRSA